MVGWSIYYWVTLAPWSKKSIQILYSQDIPEKPNSGKQHKFNENVRGAVFTFQHTMTGFDFYKETI